MSKPVSLETRINLLEAQVKMLQEQSTVKIGKNGKPKRERKPEDPDAPKSAFRLFQAAAKPFWDSLSKDEKKGMQPHNHLVLHGYLWKDGKGKTAETLTEDDVTAAVAYLTAHPEFKSGTQIHRSGNTSVASKEDEEEEEKPVKKSVKKSVKKAVVEEFSDDEEDEEEEEEEEEVVVVKKTVKKAGRPKKVVVEDEEDEEKPAKKAGRPKKVIEKKEKEEKEKKEKKKIVVVTADDEVGDEEAEEFTIEGTDAGYRLKNCNAILNNDFEFIGMWDPVAKKMNTEIACPTSVANYLKTLN